MRGRELLIAVVFAAVVAPSARAACTSQGHPTQVTLTSQVVEVLDDASYRAGRDVWVPAATKADAQVLAWLVWSEWPTGKGCEVQFTGVRNNSCGSRVDIQFEQRTDYNVGVMVSDMANGDSRYPYTCSVIMGFHIEDTKGNPIRPGSTTVVPDPGFDLEARLSLEVTNLHYETPGGVPSVPPGVRRTGCPEAQPGDRFPVFMLYGPGCAAPGTGGVNSNPASSSSISSNTSWQGVSASSGGAAIASQSPAGSSPVVAARRAAARARLTEVLGQVAADTAQRNGRPVLVR